MRRYEKIVLEAEDKEKLDVLIEAESWATFEAIDGENGELILRKLKLDRGFIYDTSYKNPPIPNGYKYVCGKWNNGLVIERCSDRSQFVWVPVGSLDSNGTFDGDLFIDKFGRRNYLNEESFKRKFHEKLTEELSLQLESVKKYGGFYISRYNISKNKKTGKPQSIKGVSPWVFIDFDEAQKIASQMEDSQDVKSHLTFGAEYDSVLEWFIKSKARTRGEIEESSNWGRYDCFFVEARKTGSQEENITNNIYDFADNVSEWTQEQALYSDYFRIIRGCYISDNRTFRKNIVCMREEKSRSYFNGKIGFRVALYFK